MYESVKYSTSKSVTNETYVDSAIQNKDALSQERQRNALAKAILSRFCPCEARDHIEIHMKRQGDISRLASRLQNYIHQQDAFKEELIRTYGPKETAALILDYARTKGTIEGDICVGDLHNFTAFWRIARPFIDNQGPNPSLSDEHIPKLKSTTPGSVVLSLPLQHRVMITKTDSGGVCTVRKGRDHRVFELATSDLTTGKPNEQYENPVIFGLYHEQLWESAKLMQNQNKRKDTSEHTFMKWAPDLPIGDIDSLTSTERFVFLHAVVNSAMTFLSTEGGLKRTEDDFVHLLLQAVNTREENGWKMLAQRLQNAREQGLYFGDIMEMMCKQMNIEKTKDKVFRTVFNNDVPPNQTPQQHILNMHKNFLSLRVPERELEAVENTIGGMEKHHAPIYITLHEQLGTSICTFADADNYLT